MMVKKISVIESEFSMMGLLGIKGTFYDGSKTNIKRHVSTVIKSVFVLVKTTSNLCF